MAMNIYVMKLHKTHKWSGQEVCIKGSAANSPPASGRYFVEAERKIFGMASHRWGQKWIRFYGWMWVDPFLLMV